MTHKTKPVRNWDKAFSRKEILLIGGALLTLLLIIALILFLASSSMDPVSGNPYSILQKRVFQDFSIDGPQ